MRSSSDSICSSRSGSASSEARKARSSEAVSRSRSSASRSSLPARSSSGARRSSGARARSASATRPDAPSPSSGASASPAAAAPSASSVTWRRRSRSARRRSSVSGSRPSVSSTSARSSASRASAAAASWRQLVVSPAGGAELAPGDPQRGASPELRLAGEPVEQVELVGGPGEAALLELPRHRHEPLGRGGHVLARSAAAPGIGARAAVREDAPCEHEPLLVLGPQLGKRARLLVVEEARRRVELGLDVRLVAVRPDERRVAARAEQQADRLGQDRLPGAGFAGDRVQPGPERELGLADQDEVLDAEPAKHAWMLRRPAAGGDPPKAHAGVPRSCRLCADSYSETNVRR